MLGGIGGSPGAASGGLGGLPGLDGNGAMGGIPGLINMMGAGGGGSGQEGMGDGLMSMLMGAAGGAGAGAGGTRAGGVDKAQMLKMAKKMSKVKLRGVVMRTVLVVPIVDWICIISIMRGSIPAVKSTSYACCCTASAIECQCAPRCHGFYCRM